MPGFTQRSRERRQGSRPCGKEAEGGSSSSKQFRDTCTLVTSAIAAFVWGTAAEFVWELAGRMLLWAPRTDPPG